MSNSINPQIETLEEEEEEDHQNPNNNDHNHEEAQQCEPSAPAVTHPLVKAMTPNDVKKWLKSNHGVSVPYHRFTCIHNSLSASSTEEQMEDTHSSVKRGKGFTADEDVAICNAWLAITQDPVVGNLQTQNNFWNRVFQQYEEENKDQVARTPCSIQSRWGIITRSCKKFHGYLTQIENRQQSGMTETDKVFQAKLLYLEHVKKQFSLDHCWTILKKKMKWQELRPPKTSNSPATPKDFTPISPCDSQIPSSLESDPDSLIRYNCESPKVKRPSGRKVEKEMRRKKKKVKDRWRSRFCDLMEQFNKQAYEIEKRKAELEERKVRVMEETNEREQKEKDDMIMMIDTSQMNPQTKAYYQQRKKEVYQTMTRSANANVDIPLAHSPSLL